MPHSTASQTDIRAQLREAVAHFEHVLPAQAPIRDFVHHNTLHGFQHLPFPQALAEAHRITGAYGYQSSEQFRDYFRQGRISHDDLLQVLSADEELQADEPLFTAGERSIRRRDILLAAMANPLTSITSSQLSWQIEELNALRRLQPDVAEESRQRLLKSARANGLMSEEAAVDDLWSACLESLGLEHYILHPEELLDLAPHQAEQMLASLLSGQEAESDNQPMVHRLMRKEAAHLLDQLLANVGEKITLRGLLLPLTGQDLLDELRPTLIRQVAAYLDQGMAAWRDPARTEGFYASWRRNAARDLAWVFDELPDWNDHLQGLPDDALDAVIDELKRLGLPRAHWASYLERLALELPGWSGMFLWRHLHPGYEGSDAAVEMMDYLAVRLVLERLFAERLCRRLWQVEPRLDMIRWYFRRRRSEFLVRWVLFNARLPEYLTHLAQRLCDRPFAQDSASYRQWQETADMIWTWRQSPGADRPLGYSIYRSAWPLFRLAQHLGLCGPTLRGLGKEQLAQIFASLELLDAERSGLLWLQAYERHYREEIFQALAANHGRGLWQRREQRPEGQIVFCMDDREESMRRHLEELNPAIETLGAAGFFGVPVNWRGLDDSKVTPLCPVVVKPSHEIRELPQAGHEGDKTQHDQRRFWRLRARNVLHQEVRRNLFSSAALIGLAAPATLAVLAGKVLAPLGMGRLAERLRRGFDLTVPTRVAITADSDTPATPEQPRLGFTDNEQADRVQNFLRAIGLTSGFAPLVVMMGHGSISLNNPHMAAYDCGACSGRHGGPNARIFAAMANRPEIRARLRERGIVIPDDTWFLGAEHNTCDDSVTWYDLDQVPQPLQEPLAQLDRELVHSTRLSAQERCRRLFSAPATPSPEQALRHVIGRSLDFSQARPELGHANNAAAFIGRRSMSQGAFFDHRVYLISYDPTQDPSGQVLEAILLAAGPVGAGISLEYYFSTVNNDQYGAGSKVTHNVTGLFGVMEGAGSDLRTGLPKQMIEIHEAMRLLVVVEASIEVLTAIYTRQPPLQELIGNGWLILAAQDPESGALSEFNPAKGFVPWAGPQQPLPTVARSADWYRGHSGPLAPALIKPVEAATHA